MLNNCSNSSKKWRSMLSELSNIEDIEKLFHETMIHKEYVIESCEKLARYLDSKGAILHARMLRERAIIHDDSKVTNFEEMIALSKLINDNSTMTDPTKQLSSTKQEFLKVHWKNNTHHPEHYDSVLDMSKLDIMEMCCDWHARSTEYNSDFLNFVKKRQEERFHFPDWMFAEIWHYCTVLNSDI